MSNLVVEAAVPQTCTIEDVEKIGSSYGNKTLYAVGLVLSIFLGLLPFLIACPLYLNNSLKNSKNTNRLVSIIEGSKTSFELRMAAARVLSVQLKDKSIFYHVSKKKLKEVCFPNNASRLEKLEIAKKIIDSSPFESSMHQLGLEIIDEVRTIDLPKEAEKYMLGEIDAEKTKALSKKRIAGRSFHEFMTRSLDPSQIEPVREDLKRQGFQVLDPQRMQVLTHSDFPGWVLKGGAKKNPLLMRTHVNPLRVVYADELRKIIQKENLQLLHVPKKGFVPTGVDSQEFHEKFYVFSEELNLLSPEQTMIRLNDLPDKQKEEIANQICILLSKSGYEDFNFENFRFLSEQTRLVIIDTEPSEGPLYSNEEGQDKRPFNPNIGLKKFQQLIQKNRGNHFSPDTIKILLDVVNRSLSI